MPRTLFAVLLLTIAVAVAACERRQMDTETAEPAAPAAPGEVSISFGTEPDPPQAPGETTLRVEVTDREGRAVPDADVRVVMVMPMGEMGDMREVAELRWDGRRYSGTVNLPMAGGWNVQVEVTHDGRPLETYETEIEAASSSG